MFYNEFVEELEKNKVKLLKDKALYAIPFKVEGVEYGNNIPKFIIKEHGINEIVLHVIFDIVSIGKSAGAIHLLEHLMCSKVKDGRPYLEVSPYLKSIGLRFGAWTGYSYMGFEFGFKVNNKTLEKLNKSQDCALDKSFKEFIDETSNHELLNFFPDGAEDIETLIENVFDTEITKEDFEREKSIVISEISNRSDAQDVVMDAINNTWSDTHISLGGTRESLEKVTYEDILKLREILRDPRNISHIIVNYSTDAYLKKAYSIYNSLLRTFKYQFKKLTVDTTKMIESKRLVMKNVSNGNIKPKKFKDKDKLKELDLRDKSFVISKPVTMSIHDDSIESVSLKYDADRIVLKVITNMLMDFYRNKLGKTYAVQHYTQKYDFDKKDDKTTFKYIRSIMFDLDVDTVKEAFSLYDEFIKSVKDENKEKVNISDEMYKSIIEGLIKDDKFYYVRYNDSFISFYDDVSKYMSVENYLDMTTRAIMWNYIDKNIYSEITKTEIEEKVYDTLVNSVRQFIIVE